MYRVQFKNDRGHVFSTEVFDSDDDAWALRTAQGKYVPAFGHGFDLWDEDRLVFSFPRRATD